MKRKQHVLQAKIDRVMRWKSWRPVDKCVSNAETNDIRSSVGSTESWVFMRMSLLMVSYVVALVVVDYINVHEIFGIVMISMDCLMSSLMSCVVFICELMLYIQSYNQAVPVNNKSLTHRNSAAKVLLMYKLVVITVRC